MYSVDLLLKRCLRLYIPFIIIFVIEEIFLTHNPQSIKQIIIDFLYGGIGPGRNMLPILIEILLVFPLLYKTIKKYGYKAIITLIFINFLFEYFCADFHVQRKYYMVNALRFLTSCTLGTYLSLYKETVNKKFIISCGIIGLSYCIYISITYMSMYPFITHVAQALPVQLWYFALFYLLYSKFYNTVIPGIIGKIIDIIGKSSWHIFLVQMVYFIVCQYLVNQYGITTLNPLFIVISIVICVVIGIIFWFIETETTKRIKQIFSKQ